MSWQATNWARTQTTGSPAVKVILLLLADLADENHSCFPGQARLAEDSEQHVNSVARHLKTLETLGLIRRSFRYDERGKRTSDRYHLAVDGPFPEDWQPRAIPSEELPTNLVGSESGGLPTNQPGDYPPPVVGEPLEDPSDVVVQGVSQPQTAPGQTAPPVDNPASTTASPGRPEGWDEFGPLAPQCPDHVGGPDVPCRRCQNTRERFETAAIKREDARRREENRLAFERDRKARAEAEKKRDDEAVARAREEARAAIARTRQAQKAAPASQNGPEEPLTPAPEGDPTLEGL